MKPRNTIIAPVVLLSLFSGPLSISERVYLFILFIPKRNSFEESGDGRGELEKEDKTTSTASIERNCYNFSSLSVWKNFF
jgi:hypothetical protein